MEEQIDINEKKGTRIVNTIIRWFWIAMMAVLLGVTAGVYLYRNHFRLFVIMLCLIPVSVGIDILINSWAKKMAAERLRAETAESESGHEKPPVASASRNFDASRQGYTQKNQSTGFKKK